MTRFGVLLAFIAYATYAAIANRDYYARYDPLGRVLRSWRHRRGRSPAN